MLEPMPAAVLKFHVQIRQLHHLPLCGMWEGLSGSVSSHSKRPWVHLVYARNNPEIFCIHFQKITGEIIANEGKMHLEERSRQPTNL